MHQTDVTPVDEDEYYKAVQDREEGDEGFEPDEYYNYIHHPESHEEGLDENTNAGQLSPFSKADGPKFEPSDEPGALSPLSLAGEEETWEDLQENYSTFSGNVRNKDMFVDAIGNDKGWSVAKACEDVLSGKPLESVEQHMLETIRDYALAKSEEELAEAIQKYLEVPREQPNMNEQRKEVFDYVYKLAEMIEGEGLTQINEYGLTHALKLIKTIGVENDYHWRPIVTTLKETQAARNSRVALSLGKKLRESLEEPAAKYTYAPFGNFVTEDDDEEGSTQFFGSVSNKDALVAQVESQHGWAVAEQADDVISGAPMEELNPNALKAIFNVANSRGENELADAIAQYLGISFEPHTQSPYKTGGQLSDEDFVNMVDQKFGWSVSSQAKSVLAGEPLEDQNPNALRYIADYARTVGRDDVADMIEQHLGGM